MNAIARNKWALPTSCLAIAATAELVLIGACFALGNASVGDSFLSVGGTILLLSHLPALLLLSLLGLKFPAGFLGWFLIGTIQLFAVFWCIAQMAKRIRSDWEK